MKQHGVLFTAMTVILIVAILLLRQSIESSRNTELQSSALYNALDSTNNKMANLQRSITNQNKIGTNKVIDERSLPFHYNINGTEFQIDQLLPVKSQIWFNYFDLINGFKAFVGDSNFSHAYDGLRVNASTIQNSPWNGTADRLRFMVFPQCMRYELLYDSNKLDIVNFTGTPRQPDCLNDFDIQSIARIDVNLTIFNSAEDFNSVTFDFNAPFDPTDPNPYFNVNILDGNCISCNIPANQKNITGHVRSNQPNKITLSCSGGTCATSKNILLSIGTDSNIVHDGRQVGALFQFTFKKKVENYYLLDFNLAVTNADFNITQRNR